MQLHARIPIVAGREPFIARLTTQPPMRTKEARLVRRDVPAEGVVAVILPPGDDATGAIPLPESLSYLSAGDIVRLNQAAGEIRVLYRRNSRHNVLFFTERCNSRCLMCSQPPREIDDSYLIDDILEAIPLMDSETQELCITGGEPTLLGGRFLEVIEAVKENLPNTSLHILSNGRLFRYAKFAYAAAVIGHADMMIGIPLYSDIACRHDFVVQAHGAFDETIRGIMNLARFGVKIEIRFVIHKQTVDRLPQTARFIARNLPFVNQVALMGLEMTGFTKSNLEALWIDPAEYQPQLAEAVHELRSTKVMIYNHPLCVLNRELWPIARQSISDWKNIYMPECEPCTLKNRCCGFFASATLRYSSSIRPFSESPNCATSVLQ
jgi:His-Xaa-Ser system radical SAM maturase HxsC